MEAPRRSVRHHTRLDLSSAHKSTEGVMRYCPAISDLSYSGFVSTEDLSPFTRNEFNLLAAIPTSSFKAEVL